MKWNVLLGTLVLAFGLCAQSYGFDLLDRMLGKDGCCQKDGDKANGPSFRRGPEKRVATSHWRGP